MATRLFRVLALCASLFCTVFLPFFAEETTTPTDAVASEEAVPTDFWFEEVEGDIVFTQHLYWDPVPYCPWYDVTVQKNVQGNEWETVLETRVEESGVEVQLAPGEYRYRVIVYNVLEKPEGTSEWFPVTVIRARQPRVSSVSPGAIYFEEENSDIFSVRGENLFSESVIIFRLVENHGRKYRGVIEEVDSRERNAEVRFPLNAIPTGDYELVVENPGGLTAVSDPVRFAYIKPMDIDVSAGIMPLFVLWDNTIEEYFDSGIVPLGAVIRLTWIPAKRTTGFYGVGAIISASRLSNETQYYDLTMNWFMGHVVFVYQRPIIKQRLNLELHAGPGITVYHDIRFTFSNNIESPDYSPSSVSALAGASLHVYLRKRLYVDVSIDASMVFMEDMRAFSLHPSLSGGWQF